MERGVGCSRMTVSPTAQAAGPCDMRLGCEALPGCVTEVRAIGAGMRQPWAEGQH